MAGAFPPVRTEGRVPKKVLVELYSFDTPPMRSHPRLTSACTAPAFSRKLPGHGISVFPFARSRAISFPAPESPIAIHFQTVPFRWVWSCFTQPGIGPHSAQHLRRRNLTDSPLRAARSEFDS